MVKNISGRKQKIVIAGAYGCGNAGDDAILAGLLRMFDPELWDITVQAADPPRIQGIEKVRLVRQQLNLGLSLKVLKAFDFIGILSAIRQTDLLIVGGGALLHDLRFYNLPYFFGLQFWAGLWHASTVYFNIGAGPIRSGFGKWLCRRFLSRAAHISVRDENGKTELVNAGIRGPVHVSADPAFMLSPEDVPDEIAHVVRQEQLPESFIAVTLCGWFKSEDFWQRDALDLSRSVARTAEILDWIIERTAKPLVFIPTVIPYDRDLAARISGSMKHKDRFQWLQKDHSVEMLMGILGKADWLFGMRLHSMILSEIMQTPFFAVVYDQKVTCFMDMIENPHRVQLEDLNKETVFKALDRFVTAQSGPPAERQHHAMRMKQKLQDNFQQLLSTNRSLKEAHAS